MRLRRNMMENKIVANHLEMLLIMNDDHYKLWTSYAAYLKIRAAAK
jgi:hypothetical protein